MEFRPEVLTHPNIPKPLHGLNPRTIMGKTEWDRVRFQAQRDNDYYCIACNTHKTEAKKHQWLEGHEYWDIDYQTGLCKVERIIPLCHYCHNFIHSGRLAHIYGGEKSEQEVEAILEHGFSILSANNLKCFEGTWLIAKSLGVNTFSVSYYVTKTNPALEWVDYRLEYRGEVYTSKFKSEVEWEQFYRG